LIWAVGALGGWAVVERLRLRGTPVVDPVVLNAVVRWAEELGVTRRVQVVLTAVESPVTAGWWRPVVMLPISALTGLGRAELEAVLAHELAADGDGGAVLLSPGGLVDLGCVATGTGALL